MSLAAAALIGAIGGLLVFGIVVCGWVIVLLLLILEELRCVERLLRPGFYQRLGLRAPEV